MNHLFSEERLKVQEMLRINRLSIATPQTLITDKIGENFLPLIKLARIKAL